MSGAGLRDGAEMKGCVCVVTGEEQKGCLCLGKSGRQALGTVQGLFSPVSMLA